MFCLESLKKVVVSCEKTSEIPRIVVNMFGRFDFFSKKHLIISHKPIERNNFSAG